MEEAYLLREKIKPYKNGGGYEIQRAVTIYLVQLFLWVQTNPFFSYGLEGHYFNILPVHSSFCPSQFQSYFCHLQPKEPQEGGCHSLFWFPALALVWISYSDVFAFLSTGLFLQGHFICLVLHSHHNQFVFFPGARHPLEPQCSAYKLRKTFGCYPEETHTSTCLRGSQ